MQSLSEVVQKNRETLLAQQLQLEQQQFERLKHDFSYNLSLLRERDAELEVDQPVQTRKEWPRHYRLTLPPRGAAV